MSRITPFLAFIMLICCAQVAKSQNYRDSLNAALQNYLQEEAIPGFSVLILHQDKVIFENGYGFANLEKKQAFDTNTMQNIGSVSKTFIAVALMKAIELGYFTPETNINDILPFHVRNPNRPNDVIKIKYLTTHTSGIIDRKDIYNRSYRFAGKPQNELLIQMMKSYHYTSDLQDTTLAAFLKNYLSADGRLYSKDNFGNAETGRKAAYSNIGSALAAYLIEVKSGMSFADFSKKYIFNPLGMQQSTWFLPKSINSNQATPYLNKGIFFPYYHLTTYPDGGLRTSARELSFYLKEMMGSLNHHPKLLRNESVEQMFKPAFNENNLPQDMSLKTRNKGVLWNLYNDGYIGHDGDDPGVSANVIFNKNLGIIYLSNIYIEDRTKILTILKKYAPLIAKQQ